MGFGPEEAEDLVQDVFAAFLDGLDRFEGRSATGTWLRGILVHKMQERRRERWRESQHDPIDEIVESRFNARGAWVRPPIELHRLIASKELGVAIEACARRLPRLQRAAFVLRDMLDLETDEICNDVLHDLSQRGATVGITDIGGLPWAEMDDASDLRFARDHVYPEIVRFEHEPSRCAFPRQRFEDGVATTTVKTA